MRGFDATYAGIFQRSDEGRPAVERIEIPIIQRDYAQGREDNDTVAIRREFLDVLIRAATTDASVSLDFIYGEVANGVLKPLDGQQRLTTLFLLHWYVASRADRLDSGAPWTRFRYATRLSAEYFCHELVTNAWPQNGSDPVEWITDQPWYLFPWRTDPTIQSMLVVIKSIHERLVDGDHDFLALWRRLTSTDSAAISFLFLPIDDMESGDDLYIKMNSRGKPLTEFEVFKARLEKLLESSGRRVELSEKMDREWADLLWHYEGGNFLVDEEFMNYLGFIIDVCEWRTGVLRNDSSLLDRAERLFVDDEAADTNLKFLFFAFDTWVGTATADDIPGAFFPAFFAVGAGRGSGLLLFESENPNLFEAALRHYGSKQFSLAETLLLYAVIIHRQQCPDESDDLLTARLRSLRNIAESAPDEVRNEYMPELIASTGKLMTDPIDSNLDGLRRFNQARVDDERLKRDLVAHHPEVLSALRALEDHELLRGRLFAFPLDPATLAARGETFREVAADDALPRLSSALLTKGDYSRGLGSRRQFGPARARGRGSWRDVLTSGSRDSRDALRSSMSALLDDVASRRGSALEVLDEIVNEWLDRRDRSGRYDWRYYFVRYPVMLSARQGIYKGSYDAAGRGFGYEVDMLNGRDYRSAFTDPYLLAIWNDAGRPDELAKPEFRSWDQSGSDKAMRFIRSGMGLRNLDAGFRVLMPQGTTQAAVARATLSSFGLGADDVVRVQKVDNDAHKLDAEDRVRLGVGLVRALLDAGL